MLGKAARYYRRDALERSFFVYSQKLTVSAHFAKVQPAPKPSRIRLEKLQRLSRRVVIRAQPAFFAYALERPAFFGAR
jgi:hypothetical protein